MTRSSRPPVLNDARNVAEWSRQLARWLQTRREIRSDIEPYPVLLAHRTGSFMNQRPVTDGIVLHDPRYETSLIAINNEWRALTSPVFELSYTRANLLNGASLSANSGNKVPFNAEDSDAVPWATFNSGTNDFDLIQGKYHLEGFYCIARTTATGGISATGYCAESASLGTPVGTVQGSNFVSPAGVPAGFTDTLSFRGELSVPQGGGTYSISVYTTSANLRFGQAHNTSGFQNHYAKLTIRLLGTNE